MFANSACVRLAHISVSHSYNLRRCRADRSQRVVFDRTPTRQVGIAARRKPDPQGQPGYLRAARLAKAPQGRHPPRDAPAASQPPQRHGSGPADAESQARPASPLSTSSLIPSDFCSDGSRARELQTPAPLPRTPIPRCRNATERRTPAAPPFRSSFFRLILGLENARKAAASNRPSEAATISTASVSNRGEAPTPWSRKRREPANR